MGLNLNQASTRVAIIGRGIAGLSLAYRLCKRGLKPVIYGGQNLGECASLAAQGVICNKGLLWPYQPLFRAKIQSLAWVKRWLIDIEQHTSCPINCDFSGVFEPYRSFQEFHKIHRRVYKGQFTGCFGNRNLPAENLPIDFSARKNFLGTLYYPGDGWFDPKQVLASLEQHCKQSGASFINSRVSNISKQAGSLAVHLQGMETKNFDRLIIAAGHGSDSILRKMGLSGLKFFHHPGQVLRIKRNKMVKNWAMVRKAHSLIARDALYLGATTDKLQALGESWQPEARQDLWNILEREFGISQPTDQNSEVDDLWGIRLRTFDRLPLIGSLADYDANWNGVYLLTGFYKSGLQLADMASQWLEQELFGEGVDKLAQAFSPKRIQNA